MLCGAVRPRSAQTKIDVEAHKQLQAVEATIGSTAVAHSNNPTTAIRVILRGARSVATSTEPTAPGMPSFAWQLNNDQIAAVTTYIRNSWGNSAFKVSPSAVEKRKVDLKSRPD